MSNPRHSRGIRLAATNTGRLSLFRIFVGLPARVGTTSGHVLRPAQRFHIMASTEGLQRERKKKKRTPRVRLDQSKSTAEKGGGEYYVVYHAGAGAGHVLCLKVGLLSQAEDMPSTRSKTVPPTRVCCSRTSKRGRLPLHIEDTTGATKHGLVDQRSRRKPFRVAGASLIVARNKQ